MNQYVHKVMIRLKDAYPDAHIELNYTTPWELLVAVMLSAQCTDVMVNKVTGNIFRKYSRFDDYLKISLPEFEQDIRPTGFYKSKAKHILESVVIINTRYHGNVPDTMEELLELPGVARKTANIVLGNAFHSVVGIAVDTHVSRISQRLRLVDPDGLPGRIRKTVLIRGTALTDYVKDADTGNIEVKLMHLLPKTMWHSVTYRLISHGRSVCKAVNPKCVSCPLDDLCPVKR